MALKTERCCWRRDADVGASEGGMPKTDDASNFGSSTMEAGGLNTRFLEGGFGEALGLPYDKAAGVATLGEDAGGGALSIDTSMRDAEGMKAAAVVLRTGTGDWKILDAEACGVEDDVAVVLETSSGVLE